MENLYRKFLEYLLTTGQNLAAEKLASDLLADILKPELWDPSLGHKEEFSFGHINTEDKLEIHEGSMSSENATYPMKAKPRGYCVLINNYLNFATFKEMHRFRKIFYQLHYEVIFEQNLKYDQMNELLNKLSKNPGLKNHSSIIFIILSHGNDKKEFFSFDGKSMKIDHLKIHFNNENCPALMGKPRIFIMNCCRGGKTQIILEFIFYLNL